MQRTGFAVYHFYVVDIGYVEDYEVVDVVGVEVIVFNRELLCAYAIDEPGLFSAVGVADVDNMDAFAGFHLVQCAAFYIDLASVLGGFSLGRADSVLFA